jgi:hypothetical protein
MQREEGNVSELTYTSELTTVTCWCGLPTAIPETLYKEARRSGRSLYCPLGHLYGWKARDDLKARAEELEKRLADERARSKYWRDEQERTERQKTALHRQFVNVERHMQSKHPNYADESS